MKKIAIIDQLIRIIQGEELAPSDLVNENSNFKRDLNFDSLDCIEFLMMVEDEFDVKISDEEAESFHDKTISDLAEFLENKK